MKRIVVLIATAALSAVVWAQTTDATVRKIDVAQGKVTLNHGEIKNLDMPPMTMVFRVKDPTLLKGLAEGTKVKFSAQKIDGQYVVTEIKAQ